MNAIQSQADRQTISILYYPTQLDYLCCSHAKLEVGRRCYVLKTGDNRQMPLKERIDSALRGNLPFERILINVTPQQFENLKNNISKIDHSITCMAGVAGALSKYADFYIPFPVSIWPTLSYAYLRCAKKIGHPRICAIETYCTYKNTLDMIKKVICPLGAFTLESAMTIGACLVAAFFINLQLDIYYGTLGPDVCSSKTANSLLGMLLLGDTCVS